MILLNKGTLTRKGVLFPEKMSLDIEERNSRATLELGPEAPGITIGDWMQDDTDPGKGMIWRVASIEPTYETGTTRVTLEHIISELKDTIIFGELDLHGSAENALRNILGRSQYWTLGSCAYSVSLPYEFDGDTLFEAVEGICETLEDSWWDYDLSAVPFRLHIRRLADGIGSEMRAGRNIKTIRKTIDRNGMYTRFYPIGKEEMRLSGTPYVSRNEDRYGVISETETNQSIDSEDMLRAWAEGRVRRHCDPTVTVTVSGLELVRATGEPLDRFRMMTMCRIPIPEIGETITERITHLSYPEKIGNPETVTVTMSNKTADVTTLTAKIRQENQKTRSGGRAGGKKAEEDHAWFTDTTDHVSMTAEAIVGKNPDGTVDWGRVADITVNGDGIYSTVTKTEKDMVTAQSSIKQLENTIDMTVKAVGKDGKITAASIVMAVNNAGSSVVISADHIQLNGNVALSDAMTASALGVNFKKSVNVQGSNGIAIGAGGYISLGAYSIRLDTLQGMIRSASVSGNVLTLTPFYGNPINFSKATAQSGKWSGGIYTVTAKQNNESVGTNKTQIKQLNQSGEVGVIGKYVGQNVHVYATENGGSNAVSTGFDQEVWIDASEVYENGKREGSSSYRLFGYFDKYGTVSVEGQTYTAYITQNTSESASHLALYRT